jgi:hypothetical protein
MEDHLTPDNNFVPRDLQISPAKLKPASNFSHPNLVIEIGDTHKRWQNLKDDARTRAQK